MLYKEFLPKKQLQEIVENYWVFEVLNNKEIIFPIEHETFPESYTSIVLIRQPYYTGIRILGPRTKKFTRLILPNSIYFGVRLHPWLIMQPNLFNTDDIINKTIEASDLISEHLKVDNDFKLNTSSLNSIENDLALLFNTIEIQKDDLVKFICCELSEGKPIHSIIQQVPYSVRVIQKRFKAIIGINMRQFAYNIKQRNLWIDLLKNESTKFDIILKHNYYDQSHFINEFKRKMKRSSKDYETYLNSIKISLV